MVPALHKEQVYAKDHLPSHPLLFFCAYSIYRLMGQQFN